MGKEIKAVEDKLEVVGRFKSTVGKIEELVGALTAFDNSLKTLDAWKDAATAELLDVLELSSCSILTAFDNSLKTLDAWKDAATAELKDIKEASGAMLPEDRVARTMDLQEDIAAKLEILKANAKTEQDLL